jgi:glutamine amidotransferase
MIAIVDYGIGNVRSIENMLRKAGVGAAICAEPPAIAGADGLILPGVGAFDSGMERLESSGLRSVLDRCVQDGMPVLGICLGMQMMMRGSDEGMADGLGWIPGRCVRLRGGGSHRVPHMGWGDVRPEKPSALFADPSIPQRFYFLHSYAVVCDDSDDVLARTTHGEEFVCAIGRGAVMGVQFHPEKSHRFGLELLRQWAAAACRSV